jgi:hypothetical protein
MASRLEAATKQFGTEILLSGEMHDILSSKMQEICREIDTVTVKGSVRPVRLFTVPIDIDGLESTKDPMQSKSMRKKKFLRYKLRKMLFSDFLSGKTTPYRELTRDHEIIELRRFHDENFEA